MRKIINPRNAHHCAELAYIVHGFFHGDGMGYMLILAALGVSELVVWLCGEH